MDDQQAGRRPWPINKWPSVKATEPDSIEPPTATQQPSATQPPMATQQTAERTAPERPPWPEVPPDPADNDDAPPWDRPTDVGWPTDATDPNDAPWDRPLPLESPEPLVAVRPVPTDQDPDDALAPVVGDVEPASVPAWRTWPTDQPLPLSQDRTLSQAAHGAPPVAHDDAGVKEKAPDSQVETGEAQSPSMAPASPPVVGQWIVSTPPAPGMPQQLVLRIEVAIVDQTPRSSRSASARIVEGEAIAVPPPAPELRQPDPTAPWADGPWPVADPLSSLPAAPVPLQPAAAAPKEDSPPVPTVQAETTADAEEAVDAESLPQRGRYSGLINAALTVVMAVVVAVFVFVFIQFATGLLR